MGTLASNQQQQIDPRQQALLGMAGGMLSQGYSPLPQSPTQPLGAGIQQGMNAYNDAMILRQQQMAVEAEKQELAQKAKVQQQQQEQLMSIAGMLPENQRQVFMARASVDPDGALKDAQTLLFPPEAAPEDITMSTYWGDALRALGATPEQVKQDPELAAVVEKLALRNRRASSPAPVAPNDYTKALVERDMDYISVVNQGAAGAIEKMQSVNTIKGLNQAIESGSMAAPLMTNIQGIMQDVGLAPISENNPVAAREALEALATEMVRQERLYGPKDSRFTDQDMKMYLKSIPSLSQTKEGRELITSILESRQMRLIDRQQKLEDFIAENEQAGLPEEQAVKKGIRDLKQWERDSVKREGSVFRDVNGELNELGRQMDALSSGSEAPPAVKRTGTDESGRRVRELADGTIQVQDETGKWVDR